MLWFLYQCFGKNNRQLQKWFIAVMVVHLAMNIAMVLEIILQCGPNPYRLTNRVEYWHLMWDGPPEDGSGKCLDLNVEVIFGYVQEGNIPCTSIKWP